MSTERMPRIAAIYAVPNLEDTIAQFRVTSLSLVETEFRYPYLMTPQIASKPDKLTIPGLYLYWQEGNDITGENLGTGDGTTLTFNHTLAHFPVEKNSFSFTFTAPAPYGTTTVKDDGNGHLVGTGVVYPTSTINYLTGSVHIVYDWTQVDRLAVTHAPANATTMPAAYTYWNRILGSDAATLQVLGESIGSGDATTVTFAGTLKNTKPVPGSFSGQAGNIFFKDDGAGGVTGQTQYNGEAVGTSGSKIYSHTTAHGTVTPGTVVISDTVHTITDDGAGNLIGAGLDTTASNTIVYSSGVTHVTFLANAPGAVTMNYRAAGGLATSTLSAAGVYSIVFSAAPAAGAAILVNYTTVKPVVGVARQVFHSGRTRLRLRGSGGPGSVQMIMSSDNPLNEMQIAQGTPGY